MLGSWLHAQSKGCSEPMLLNFRVFRVIISYQRQEKISLYPGLLSLFPPWPRPHRWRWSGTHGLCLCAKCNGCLLRNVMGTFIRMSESCKGIKAALKQLPTYHMTQPLNLKNHTTRVKPQCIAGTSGSSDSSTWQHQAPIESEDLGVPAMHWGFIKTHGSYLRNVDNGRHVPSE